MFSYGYDKSNNNHIFSKEKIKETYEESRPHYGGGMASVLRS